jgi:voltage-dependent anion channel protein 2
LDKGETLKASYLRTVDRNAGLEVVGEILHKLPTKETTFTVGASYSLDHLTTVKARLNNHGKLGTLLQHNFRPNSMIVISSEIDTKALDRHAKVGLALALKP